MIFLIYPYNILCYDYIPLLFFPTGKLIKLNYEVNETLKMYSEVLASPSIIKPVDQENDENLLDLNILSVSPGTYEMFDINIYIFFI